MCKKMGISCFKLFWAFVISFASVVVVSARLSHFAFGVQFIIAIILLVLGMAALSGACVRSRWAYLLSALVFGLFLLDILYLYFNGAGYVLLILAASSAYGFVKSVKRLPSKKSWEKNNPRVEFGMEKLRKRCSAKESNKSMSSPAGMEPESADEITPQKILDELQSLSGGMEKDRKARRNKAKGRKAKRRK